MRRFITALFVLSLVLVAALATFAPQNALNDLAQGACLMLLGLVLLDRLVGLFRPPRRGRIPPSQVAEIEMLYFRAMREMLNDYPNLAQVTNDLHRILSIDPYYKNARHYLERAQRMQSQGEGLAAAPFKPSRTSAEFIRLQDQLIDPDPTVRRSVVMELIQYGEIAIDPLIALLMDEDGDVRVHAATALGWIGGRHAVQPLMVALQDSNPYVRRYAARAMCWVVDKTAVDGLIEALRDDDNYVRRYAARALGWSQNAAAVRPLLELLAVEENTDVREYALIALDDLGEPRPRIERPIEMAEEA